MTKSIWMIATVGALTTILAGCVTQTPTEREFGNAVRSVTTHQIHDVGAALYPPEDAVTGGNPDRLENVVKGHATDVDAGNDVRTPITIGLGTVSGR